MPSVSRGPVVAAVIFYRQTPERLDRMVRSLAGRCQGIVALDGPFVGLSKERMSPLDNYHAIADAADDIGIDWALFEGQDWWGEPQKRTAAALAAWEMGERHTPDGTWVLVLDSDEWLEDDIDWDVVLELGHGTGKMVSYKWPERTTAGGDGSLMVRLMPNTGQLVWGPAHFDVRDMSIPKTYIGWEKALANTDPVAFHIGHDLGEKIIQAEYEAYNDRARLRAEGRMMRVVEDYITGDKLVVRMDTEQINANGWVPGIPVSFNANMLGTPENGFAEVREIVPVDGIDACDIHFERIPKDEADAKIKANAEREIERRQKQSEALQRRVQKRSRKWRTR